MKNMSKSTISYKGKVSSQPSKRVYKDKVYTYEHKRLVIPQKVGEQLNTKQTYLITFKPVKKSVKD